MEERYHYDEANCLTRLTRNGEDILFHYGNVGNMLSDGRNSYDYDAFNRMTRAEAFDGNIQLNRYDAEGLRAEMEENGRLVQFIYNTNIEICRRRQCISKSKRRRESKFN